MNEHAKSEEGVHGKWERMRARYPFDGDYECRGDENTKNGNIVHFDKIEQGGHSETHENGHLPGRLGQGDWIESHIQDGTQSKSSPTCLKNKRKIKGERITEGEPAEDNSSCIEQETKGNATGKGIWTFAKSPQKFRYIRCLDVAINKVLKEQEQHGKLTAREKCKLCMCFWIDRY